MKKLIAIFLFILIGCIQEKINIPEPPDTPEIITLEDQLIPETEEPAPIEIAQPDPTPEPTPVVEPAPEPIPEPIQPPATEPVQEPTPTPQPEPTPIKPRIQFALYTGLTTYFYDGVNLIEWKRGPSAYAGNRVLSNNDILYELDQYGDLILSRQLPGIAYKLKTFGTDIYTIEHLTTTESVALGGSNNDHIRAWKNYTEIGNWDDNNYLPIDVKITLQGNLIAKIGWGQYLDINNNLISIRWADDILLYNYDVTQRTAILADQTNHAVSWVYNYMNRNPDWINANGKYYNSIGYEFDGTNLIENANKMWSFLVAPYPVSLPNPEAPVPGFAGKRTENSEEVLYIVEYASGWLMRYIPSIDRLEQKYRIYIGDNTRISGVGRRNTTNPIIIGDILFYSDSGSIWSIHLSSGIVKLFYAGSAEFWVF